MKRKGGGDGEKGRLKSSLLGRGRERYVGHHYRGGRGWRSGKEELDVQVKKKKKKITPFTKGGTYGRDTKVAGKTLNRHRATPRQILVMLRGDNACLQKSSSNRGRKEEFRG